jgi:hypothetical protein
MTLRPAIPVLPALLLLASGCTFEAQGEARAGGTASSGASEPAPAAEPPPAAEPAPTAERERARDRRARRSPPPQRRRTVRAPEPEPEPTRTRRRSRRARHAAVPAPKGPAQETDFGSTKPRKKALQGNIYFLPKNTKRLPDFEELEPVGTVYAKKLDLPERRFDKGFPGITERDEWFAVVYTGTFRVKKAGTYAFRLVSDDGSKLYINDELVIDNDGTHPPRSKDGTIELPKGEHEIVVEYFQGPRYHIALQLFWTPPGKDEAIFEVK